MIRSLSPAQISICSPDSSPQDSNHICFPEIFTCAPNIIGIQMNESLSYKGLTEMTGDCWLFSQHQLPSPSFPSKENPENPKKNQAYLTPVPGLG